MESCAILEYLGAKYGPTPLTPARDDPTYPAYISYLHFGEASLTAALNVAIGSRFFAPDDQKQNWGATFAIDVAVRKSAALLRPLARTSYVAGEVFTAADISCGYALGLARFLGFEDRLDPKLREYSGRLAQRPAFQRALRHQQNVA
jgi:glutathione S-transferase